MTFDEWRLANAADLDVTAQAIIDYEPAHCIIIDLLIVGIVYLNALAALAALAALCVIC